MTEDMRPYYHKVQYYETDMMQIVHHSNYIRWFEEARLDYLEQAHFPYAEIEARGFLIPVLGVECQYRKAVHFGETVLIETEITKFNGLKFTVSYQIYDKEHQVLHTQGSTKHCFLDQEFRPVFIKRKAPDLYEYFTHKILHNR
ncbi:MAG: acyl-CoA thioesterase [Lachnospiraceae bacterium]|nr:acyl-CoA thioesterase [Lachnospiraceae bacterium]